jgi:H+-transporting ATPase
MGIGELAFCTGVLLIALYRFDDDLDAVRTLVFVSLVFGNQATTYNNRERRRLWASRPSRWLVFSSTVDILLAAILSVAGIGMTAVPLVQVIGILIAAAVFALLLDLIKVPLFRRLQIR